MDINIRGYFSADTLSSVYGNYCEYVLEGTDTCAVSPNDSLRKFACKDQHKINEYPHTGSTTRAPLLLVVAVFLSFSI